MKRYICILSALICALFLSSCAKEIVDLTGSINGTIKDYNSGALIANCRVSLSPGGKAVTSSSSGIYEFTDLTPGDYTLTFSKAGYNDEKTAVTVVAASTVTADVLLKMKSAFAVSPSSYDFGDLESTKTFYFFNNSDSDCSYEISNIPVWLSFDRTRGTVSSSGSEAVTATVLRDKVNEGSYDQNVTITYSGKSSGVITLYLKMSKVRLTTPTVEIAYEGQNIKENSFDIVGTITATGGSQILSYGHCWSTSQTPTVNDNKTDLGTTSTIGSFTSTANNLLTFTTYYVRAYARNAQGIAYSDQIAVTTQDVGSDKWDGNIASSFAGGSGSYADPYIVKTGGQLLLMKDYSHNGTYFVLAGNIDLDNKNWKPFEFWGSLDGKGFSISNLRISRSEDNLGLFSEVWGPVSNLTIKQVSIEAPSNNNIGALCGSTHSDGEIKNCHVFFGTNSVILGNENVGGLIGCYASYSSNELTNCSVTSSSNDIVVKGSGPVGGMIGCASSLTVKNCKVAANVSGTSTVGGILGLNSTHGSYLSYCSFEGEVSGANGIGGLIGSLYNESVITACKVDAKITASSGEAGGLTGGWNRGSVCYTDFIACYTTGEINGEYCFGLASVGNAYLCYTAMFSSSASFRQLGGKPNSHGYVYNWSVTDCTSVQDCSDVTTYLKECYSTYASYWDFDSSWTWEGKVNGASKQVRCPKLAWE